MKKPRTKAPAAAPKLPGLYLRGRTWWLTWRINGIKKHTSLHTDNYVEAVRLGVQLKLSPEFQSGNRITNEMERFLAHKRGHGIYRRHSAEWARSPLKRLAAFTGDLPVGGVTKIHIENFWTALRTEVSENSAISYMRAIRSFFSWLVEYKSIVSSPVTITLPKAAQAARILFCTTDLRDQLIDEAPTWELRLILFAGMHVGFRKNEIIQARPFWFDLNRGLVSVQKTESFEPKDRETRDIPLTKSFLAFLKERPLTEPFLLRPEVTQGKSLFRYDFRAPFETYMAKMKCVWVTAHVMRHTFAAQYLSNGGSIYRLANYLGDTVEVTEKHYGHLVLDNSDIERGHRPLNQASPEL